MHMTWLWKLLARWEAWKATPDSTDWARCETCDDTGTVCENHRGRPWGGLSGSRFACECGAGSPCPECCSPIPQDGTRSIADAFIPRKPGGQGKDGGEMRIDEAVEVDRALRFWQERALAYEQALRFVIAEAHRGMDGSLDTSEMFYALHVICGTASAALDKPDQM